MEEASCRVTAPNQEASAADAAAKTASRRGTLAKKATRDSSRNGARPRTRVPGGRDSRQRCAADLADDRRTPVAPDWTDLDPASGPRKSRPAPPPPGKRIPAVEIGRASCRERV